jgi:cell division protein FtsQ
MDLSLPLRMPRSIAPPRRRRRSRHGFGSLGPDLLRARSRAARVSICLALAVPPLGGAWLWLRGSPLVAVSHVHIAGVHGPEAIPIRDALDRAASGMTTMDFSVAKLRAAVAGYPIVASLSARTSFPHGVSIAVTERPPVAVLVGPGQRTAVAADGTVLGPALAAGALPTIAVKDSAPAPAKRVSEAGQLAALAALGAAPSALLRYVARTYEGPEGLTLQMRNGLLAYFGDATLAHAKWLSLARVLSSPSSASALYVDVRLPSRPAAGFTSSTVAGHASGPATARIGSADPAAATLAERLAQATGASPTSAATGEERSAGTGANAAESEQRGVGGANAGPPAGEEQGSAGGTGPAAGSASVEGGSGSSTAGGEQAASGGTAPPETGSTSG